MYQEYTNLYVTNNGFFSFNGLIYQTMIKEARNRTIYVTAIPNASDIFLAYGSQIEKLKPIKNKVKEELCKCHEKVGKIIFNNKAVSSLNPLKYRFLHLIDKAEVQFFRDLNKGLQDYNDAIYEDLIDRVTRTNSMGATDRVRWNTHANIIRTAIMSNVVSLLELSGKEAVQVVKDLLGIKKSIKKAASVEDAAAAISFNIWSKDSQRWLQRNTSELVQGVGEQTKRGIQTIITQKVKEGMRVRDAAMQIRPMVGLNNVQAKAVLNYFARLKEMKISPAKRLARSIAYSKKLNRLRAQTIARTESRAAVAAGQIQGYKQSYVKHVQFNASPGACPVCDGFHGRIYSISKVSMNWESIPRKPGIATGKWGGYK